MSNEEIATKRRISNEKWIAFAIRLTCLIVFFTFILAVALEVQIQQRNKAIDNLNEATANATAAANEARTASEKASTDLASVLAQVNSPEAQAAVAKSRASIIETREAIARIEAQLCDGPCPEKGN